MYIERDRQREKERREILTAQKHTRILIYIHAYIYIYTNIHIDRHATCVFTYENRTSILSRRARGDAPAHRICLTSLIRGFAGSNQRGARAAARNPTSLAPGAELRQTPSVILSYMHIYKYIYIYIYECMYIYIRLWCTGVCNPLYRMTLLRVCCMS